MTEVIEGAHVWYDLGGMLAMVTVAVALAIRALRAVDRYMERRVEREWAAQQRARGEAPKPAAFTSDEHASPRLDVWFNHDAPTFPTPRRNGRLS